MKVYHRPIDCCILFLSLRLLMSITISAWRIPFLPLLLQRRGIYTFSESTIPYYYVATPFGTYNATTSTGLTTKEPKDGPLPAGANAADSVFMQLALVEARKAAKRGEVPIGAVVVRSLDHEIGEDTNKLEKCSFQVLSRASNQVEERRDASAHAEILAMRKAATNNADASWRLLDTTLYTTVEPCVMCLSAAQAFRVGRIVYGAPDLRLGAIDTYANLLDQPHPFHNIDHVVRGLHEYDSARLLRDFFRQQRVAKKKKQKSIRARNRTVAFLKKLLFHQTAR